MNDSNQHPLLKIKLIFFAISAFFLVFTAVTVIVFLTVFRVHAVDIENCKYSSKENIEKSSGVEIGMHMYAIDKEKMEEAIIAENPYVNDVRITRKGATTLCITLTEDAPRFYIVLDGKYFVLSDTLRVLAEYNSMDELSALALAPISLPKVEEAPLGKTLIFTEETEADGKECIDILSILAESTLSGTITSADVSERFDLRFTYKDKYEIRFGSPKNFADKLALVTDTIEYLEDPINGYSTAKGIIHASVTGETSFEATGAIS